VTGFWSAGICHRLEGTRVTHRRARTGDTHAKRAVRRLPPDDQSLRSRIARILERLRIDLDPPVVAGLDRC